MSKVLEALKEIECITYYEHKENKALGNAYRKNFELIENTLKDYELMKQTKIIVVDKNISDDDLEKLKNQRVLINNFEESKVEPLFNEETQKKLKALEIIKKKRVCVAWLKNGLSSYNSTASIYELPILTQEEYDLLKEVLLWGLEITTL